MFGVDALHKFSVRAMVDREQAAGFKAGTSCNARRTDLADISQQRLAGIDFGDSIAVCIDVELHKYGVQHPRERDEGLESSWTGVASAREVRSMGGSNQPACGWKREVP